MELMSFGGKTRVLVKKGFDFRGKRLLAGFHGIGFAGWIAVKYIAEKMGAERVGFVVPETIPPMVTMGEDGVLKLPLEIYLSGKHVIVVPNAQIDLVEASVYAQEIASIAANQGLSDAVLFGGLSREFKSGDEAMRAAYTSHYRQGEKPPMLNPGLFVVGPIAVMLSVFEYTGIPAIALLPYASSENPDPRAAAVAVKYFSEKYGVNIDPQPLVEEAEKLEKKIEEIRRRFEQIRSTGSRQGVYV